MVSVGMPYANHCDSTAIYYETYGEGTAIVFIHPPAMGHVTFKRQRQLANYFQLVTMDLRGNGRSNNKASCLTMSLFAEDILAVINEIGLDQVVLCGYSNGGSVVQEFALTYPSRVLGVILCGGFSEVNSFLLKNEFRIGIYAAKLKLTKLISVILAIAHAKSKLYKLELKDYIRKIDPQLLAQIYQLGLSYKATPRLHELTMPILLAYGAHDHYLHAYQQLFLERVKREVDIVYISGAKHQLPTRHSRELNKIIYNFVKKKIEA